MLQVGLERVVHDDSLSFAGQRIGYLSNQASTDRNFVHGRVLLHQKYGDRLTCLFSPQHGFFSEKQDNMIESDHALDAVTGLPIYSLYGVHRRPTAEMFAQLDVLFIDLIDVGTRVYTFLYTMAYCLEMAAQLGKKVVVLDRPNPIGGEQIEGNLLRADCTSFVGLYPLPMRHGLTFAELALLINDEFHLGAELEVVKLTGWRRSMLFRDTGFPWVWPSPNMPTPETALVYPGQVLWEGTHVSEGRGTTLPFELVGAPYWRHTDMLRAVAKTSLPGCCLRPVVFEPTSGKWAGQACCGFQIHVTKSRIFLPYRTSLALLQASIRLYPDQYQYKQPPYEYEYQRLPMDLIIGDQRVRRQLEEGVPVREIEEDWQAELQAFDRLRKKYFLY
ncbi:exo-beta-N-acetylmuramidase NamZ family protein [Desulfocastanea catecholica]